MTDFVKNDLLRSLFVMPRWANDWEDEPSSVSSVSRGLKIHEDQKNIYLDAVVAGVPVEDIQVEIEDGIVTIKAERKIENSKEGEYKSSTYNYYYTCALSGGQWNKASAEVNNGVLELLIPKVEAVRPRRITIKAKVK
jgi:HSP20 family protein